MNTQNYPTWLVPLDIARELKEIGYKEDCYFEFSKDNGLTLETLERESSIIYIDEGCYYYFEITNPNLYQLDCQGNFDSYEDAREALVKALIQTYKNELKKNNL